MKVLPKKYGLINCKPALLACIVLISTFYVDAAAQSTITSMATLDAGYSSVHDSYLSAVTYTGTRLGVGYENLKLQQNDSARWNRLWEASIDCDLVENPAGNHHIQGLTATGSYALMHRIIKDTGKGRLKGFELMAGPTAMLHGGGFYAAHNSNNVASVKIQAAIGANLMAIYNTRLWKRPLMLGYRLSLPMVGAFYSPDYDQTYYEIYLGDTSNLAHFGWWGNRFDMTNLLFADYKIGTNTTVRLGYRARYEYSHVCHITTRLFSHAFTIAIGAKFSSK